MCCVIASRAGTFQVRIDHDRVVIREQGTRDTNAAVAIATAWRDEFDTTEEA
jgi:hypothetical protein